MTAPSTATRSSAASCLGCWTGMIAPPYSAEFVALFLPLAENDEILGGIMSMRDGQEEDPVSEFIVHCRTNFTAA